MKSLVLVYLIFTQPKPHKHWDVQMADLLGEVQRSVVLFCAVLCSVVLCCAELCCAVL